jgi:hypothetical protein
MRRSLAKSPGRVIRHGAVDIKIENQDPWNMPAGFQVELTRNWHIMLEGGFIGRKQVMGMASFLF